MYIISVYDIGEKRVNKVHKIMKKYLHWIQNSVFEGELTAGLLKQLKVEINNIINKEEDSVFFFVLPNKSVINKEILGLIKSDTSNII